MITATLTLRQLGNASGWDNPNSLIQVWEINQDWDPATLSWNNAPPPIENLSRAWVGSIYPGYPGDLGIARTWDVSLAATQGVCSWRALAIGTLLG